MSARGDEEDEVEAALAVAVLLKDLGRCSLLFRRRRRCLSLFSRANTRLSSLFPDTESENEFFFSSMRNPHPRVLKLSLYLFSSSQILSII